MRAVAVDRLVARFGSQREFMRRIGEPWPRVPKAWRERGIPHFRRHQIAGAGLELSQGELDEVMRARPSPKRRPRG